MAERQALYAGNKRNQYFLKLSRAELALIVVALHEEEKSWQEYGSAGLPQDRAEEYQRLRERLEGMLQDEQILD